MIEYRQGDIVELINGQKDMIMEIYSDGSFRTEENGHYNKEGEYSLADILWGAHRCNVYRVVENYYDVQDLLDYNDREALVEEYNRAMGRYL